MLSGDVRDARRLGVMAIDDILLDPERDARLRELTELRDQGDRPLTAAEIDELEALIAAMRHTLVERHIYAAAQHLGAPVEVARGQIMAQAKDASGFWESLVADPDRMAAEVDAAKARRRARAS